MDKSEHFYSIPTPSEAQRQEQRRLRDQSRGLAHIAIHEQLTRQLREYKQKPLEQSAALATLPVYDVKPERIDSALAKKIDSILDLWLGRIQNR